ncbi:hypothetical protein AB0J52_17020 [Spirillospora sp. NPDC049652]
MTGPWRHRSRASADDGHAMPARTSQNPAPAEPSPGRHPTPALAALQSGPAQTAIHSDDGSHVLRDVQRLLAPHRARAPRPGSLPEDPPLEELARSWLAHLRATHPHWGILYQPYARAWIALHGRKVIVTATPQELTTLLPPPTNTR